MIRKTFKLLLSLLLALSFAAVLLVFVFPRERIAGWAAAKLASRLPGYECSMADVRYVHPLKLRLYRIACTNEFQGITIPVDTLLLSLPASFPVETVGVSGVVFGGDISADLRLDNLRERDKIDIEQLQVSQLQLEEIDAIRDGIERPVRGRFSFTGRASLNPDKLDTLRLSGKVRITDFGTVLRRPILSLDELSFDQVTADASLSSGVLQLSGGRAAGRMVNAVFSGTVLTAALWRNRGLDFSGSLTPQPDLLVNDPDLADALQRYYRLANTQEIPYRIGGTLREPQISLPNL